MVAPLQSGTPSSMLGSHSVGSNATTGHVHASLPQGQSATSSISRHHLICPFVQSTQPSLTIFAIPLPDTRNFFYSDFSWYGGQEVDLRDCLHLDYSTSFPSALVRAVSCSNPRGPVLDTTRRTTPRISCTVQAIGDSASAHFLFASSIRVCNVNSP